MPLRDALRLARIRGVDLVECAHCLGPEPVCLLVEYASISTSRTSAYGGKTSDGFRA